MGEVSSSGRGSSRDVLTQLKDQYEARERETERRHRDDVRQLTDGHRAEMDKLREESQKRIENLQSENNVKLSEKDVQHQKEIDAIRALYAKRLAETKASS
jgi:hypothetical protein